MELLFILITWLAAIGALMIPLIEFSEEDTLYDQINDNDDK